MNLINKIAASGLFCGLMMASVSTAQAQVQAPQAPEATSQSGGIIFRIENIKPVTNEEGLTTQCEFYVTVYNRMDKNIKEVDMDLAWTDNISAKYKVSGDTVVAERDAQKAQTVISKHVVLKEVAPHQQKVFKEFVDTDKCFLLFDQVDYRVNDCVAEGDNVEMKNSKRVNKGSCIDAFDYINSKNPEYYSEFKDVPDSVLEQMADNQQKQDSQMIDDMFKDTVKSYEEISKILEDIK